MGDQLDNISYAFSESHQIINFTVIYCTVIEPQPFGTHHITCTLLFIYKNKESIHSFITNYLALPNLTLKIHKLQLVNFNQISKF